MAVFANGEGVLANRRMEMSDIDWDKPLEAIRDDGKTGSVEFWQDCETGKEFHRVRYLNDDGFPRYADIGDVWTIRNAQ